MEMCCFPSSAAPALYDAKRPLALLFGLVFQWAEVNFIHKARATAAAGAFVLPETSASFLSLCRDSVWLPCGAGGEGWASAGRLPAPPYRDRQRADACQAEREEEPGVWQQPRAEHTNTHTGKISKTSQPHLLRLVTGSTPTNNYLVTKIRRWVEGV